MKQITKKLAQVDKKIDSLIALERKRQEEGLELIPSENYVSRAVLEAMGSVLTNKYSEGYPRKRYYGGNKIIDDVEELAQKRARKLFDVPHANVQPYSGSPANFAVYFALCSPGEVIMGQNLLDGGHLTHGWKVSVTGSYFKSIPYHVKADGELDFSEIEHLARKHKPRLIWCGATAYVKKFNYKRFAQIADEVGAYLAADIAHVAGLIVAGVHPSPVRYAHIITTTTHKTLRGPRGALIMVTRKGLRKDPSLANKIDRAVFPGLQGGPHDHTTAAIAVALHEASFAGFKSYGRQVVKNARALARELKKHGIKLVGGGTQNHLLLIDLTPFGIGQGLFVEEALDMAGMTVNKNTIPGDPSSPFYPSGIRLGTPAITTRGLKEPEMVRLGAWIAEVIQAVATISLPANKKERAQAITAFRTALEKIPVIKRVRTDVKSMCKNFPLYRS